MIAPATFEADRRAARDTAVQWTQLVCEGLAAGLASQRFGDEAVRRLTLDGFMDLAEAVRTAQKARAQDLLRRGFTSGGR